MSNDISRFAGAARPAQDADSSVYDDGYLRIEHKNYYVSCRGESLKFPRREFQILSRLALSMARIVEAEEVWRHAWDDSKPYNAESLHVHVYRLRTKLAPYGIHIETMINVGYRLVVDQDVSHGDREHIQRESRGES